MNSWTVARIRGIPLKIHFSLLLAIPYFALVIAARFLAMASLADLDAAELILPPWLWGLILAVSLFVSVALHELGHALVAAQLGRRVRGITLMLLGGVSQIDQLSPAAAPANPVNVLTDKERRFQERRLQRHEALIAVVGPVVSLILSIALYAGFRDGALRADLRFGFFYLAQINMMIALFNLVPAFPLDGGRILRALLSARLGYERGTKIAAATGQVFAALFMAFGLYSMNIILLLIGAFVFGAGAVELRMLRARTALAGLQASDVMHSVRETIASGTKVSDAMRLVRSGDAPVPVVFRDDQRRLGRIVGVIDRNSLTRIPADRRSLIPVGLAADTDVPTMRANEPAGRAIDLLVSQGPVVVVVDDDGGLEGLIDAEDISKRFKEAA